MKTKWIIIAALSIVAVIISIQWGLAFLHWPLSVLSGNETDVQIIRRVMPHHLINPDAVLPDVNGDITAPWLIKETIARMAIIWGTWGIILATVTIRLKRKHSQQGGPGYPPHSVGSPDP